MRTLILDGFESPTGMSEMASSWLIERLEDGGQSVKVLAFRNERIGHCIGCFGCWVKTPGECVIDDAGRTIAREIMASDLVVYLAPVRYGGFSSSFKKALDRFIPLILPFFRKVKGEVHHVMRYRRYPALIVLGIQPGADPEEAQVFTRLIGRNMVNIEFSPWSSCILDEGMSQDIAVKLVSDAYTKVVVRS